MSSRRFERMIGIPEDEYMHLKSLQQVYNPLQNKFQTLSNQYDKQEVITDPYVRNQRQGETLNSMIQIKDNIRQQLIQVTPKPYQSRAENLFNFISDKLPTNERGEIINDDGKVIEGSNIADLIQHAVRDRRRNMIPTGWNEFKDILKNSNAPRMILNYETLEEMQGIKRPSLATSKAMQTTTTTSSKAAQTSPSKSSSRSSSIKVGKRLRGRSRRRRPSYLDKDYFLDFESSDSVKTPTTKSKTSKERKGATAKRYVSLESKFL